jgi:hypothetical protein
MLSYIYLFIRLFIYGNLDKSLVTVESRSISPSMLIGMAFSALICDGMQEEGSYGDTFVPTSKFSCVCTMCALTTNEGPTLYQFDIKDVFLKAPCTDQVYLNFPVKYRLPKGKALKCLDLIYGLKQAAAGWNKMFVNCLKQHNFYNLDGDGVTFMKEETRNGKLCKLDILKRFHILKRFQISDANPVSTPMEANTHLSVDDCPSLDKRDPEVVRNYQQCIGACMYLTVFTRLDCCYVVNQLARFMSNPDPSHVAATRRLLRYLAGTRSLGITYKRSGQDAAVTSVGGHFSSNTLTSSADPDHAGAKDRRSVS